MDLPVCLGFCLFDCLFFQSWLELETHTVFYKMKINSMRTHKVDDKALFLLDVSDGGADWHVVRQLLKITEEFKRNKRRSKSRHKAKKTFDTHFCLGFHFFPQNGTFFTSQSSPTVFVSFFSNCRFWHLNSARESERLVGWARGRLLTRGYACRLRRNKDGIKFYACIN